MNYGSEPADQVVRYSLEGAEFALRISGTAAKNFFIFAQAVLHDSKKTHGKTHLIRLLKEQKPLKFFTVDKYDIVQGMVSTIISQSGSSGMSSVSLPQELIDAINNVGFWDSIPLWAVTLIGGLLITVLSFTMILTVYGRMFSLWMYAAIAPIPLSTFAGEPTSSVGKNFIRSYAGVCLQGVVIALSCIIFSAISSSPPAVDTDASVVTAVWTYVGELAFNLLVLVGAIKGCDRIVKEIMGL